MTLYAADASLPAKLRRRLVRFQHRRPSLRGPGRPMVSFAFDDAPLTAFTIGAGVLEARGVRGAYFVSAGLAGLDAGLGLCGGRDEVTAAAAAGHEIACHTYSHLDCGRADAATVEADLDRNLQTLAAWGLPAPTTFAYPYGDVAAPAKRQAGARFALARALHPGLVIHGSDLNQAPAVGVEGEAGEALAMRWLRRAQAQNAWLILFTHGVEDAPGCYSVSTAAWARLVDWALAAKFDVVTVTEGARRLGAEAR